VPFLDPVRLRDDKQREEPTDEKAPDTEPEESVEGEEAGVSRKESPPDPMAPDRVFERGLLSASLVSDAQPASDVGTAISQWLYTILS
jgi:hypothetical protein